MIILLTIVLLLLTYFYYRKRGPRSVALETRAEGAESTGVTGNRSYFKPFDYPWCFKAWEEHEQSHWLYHELNMQEDVFDWENKLKESEKYFLSQILRFFTQGDIDVASGYVEYLAVFRQPEIRMMLFGFGAREAIHIASYSHLITTLNLPNETYVEFLQFQAMKDKHDFIFDNKFKCVGLFAACRRLVNKVLFGYDEKIEEIATTVAIFSAFTEGVQLFSSFIMLLNFTRHGLMKKMGQIIIWSITDETCHTNSMIRLFREFVAENKNSIRLNLLKQRIYWIANKMVKLEDNFIDLAFAMGPMRDLTSEDVKQYIRYITDRRLITMGYEGMFGIKKNPLDWVTDLLNTPTHTNFFENKPTDYAKASLTGEWPW